MKIKACDIVFESEGEDRLIRKKNRQLQKKICQHIADIVDWERVVFNTPYLNVKCEILSPQSRHVEKTS